MSKLHINLYQARSQHARQLTQSMSDQFSALFVKFNDTAVMAVKRCVAEAEQAVIEKQERAQRERAELAEII